VFAFACGQSGSGNIPAILQHPLISMSSAFMIRLSSDCSEATFPSSSLVEIAAQNWVAMM
jgi:hypothetical protein